MDVKVFTEKMKIYKSGKVIYHPMMAILTNGLSAQDIADLAAILCQPQTRGQFEAL